MIASHGSIEIESQYPRISMPLTLLFNLYVVSWWLEVGKRVDFLGKIRFEFLIAAVLGVATIVIHNSAAQKVNPINRKILGGVFFYFSTLFVSLLFSQDFSVSWDTLFNRILKLSVMTLYMSVFVRSPQQLWYYLISTFLSFLKVGQEAFLGKITGAMVWENQGIMRLHGSPGTMFGHPNSLSGKIASLLPYLWILFGHLKKKWKFLFLVQVIFSINIIIFTGSRTGYIATCMALLAFLWCSKKKFRMILALILLSVVVVNTLPEQYQERFMSSFGGKEAEGHSKDTRFGLLRDSVHVFWEYPLGVGIGCFVVMQERAGRNAQGTHNLYAQILTEIGIQGFVAFSYFIFTVVQALLITKKKLSDNILKLTQARQRLNGKADEWRNALSNELRGLHMMHAVCSGTLLLLFIRAVLGVFGHDLYEIYWWVAAGFAFALSNMAVVAENRSTEFCAILNRDTI